MRYADDAMYVSKSSEVYLSTAYTGPLSATTLQNLPAAIHQPVDSVEAESSCAQRDLTIVHAPFNDIASVSLGDSSEVQQLDELTIIGEYSDGEFDQDDRYRGSSHPGGRNC